jgi:N-acetylglucosamine-6-phosphate deacetylase
VRRLRLATGSLAGSALTMDQALRNLVRVGLDWPTPRSVFPPSRPTTCLDDRGRIAPDARADLVVLDAELRLQQVVVVGAWSTEPPQTPDTAL